MFQILMKKDKEDYPKLMHPHFDMMVSEATGLEKCERHVHTGLAFQAKFAESFEKCLLSMWGSNGVQLTIVTNNMPDVLPALRWLRHEGYRCHMATDSPSNRSKTWTFSYLKDSETAWHLNVEATLSGDSVKCEYVQTGFYEPVPKLELRCEGKAVEVGKKAVEIDSDLK